MQTFQFSGQRMVLASDWRKEFRFIMLPNDTLHCNLPKFPGRPKYVGVVNNTILSCTSYECWYLTNGHFKKGPTLNTGRKDAGAITINNTLWLTGGYKDLYNNPESTTELVGLESTVKFVNLPQPLEAHCMIKVNDSMVMLTGGVDENGYINASQSTYLFDFSTNQWTHGPKLNNKWYRHGCSTFDLNNSQILVVAQLREDFLVEFLNISNPGANWTTANIGKVQRLQIGI